MSYPFAVQVAERPGLYRAAPVRQARFSGDDVPAPSFVRASFLGLELLCGLTRTVFFPAVDGLPDALARTSARYGRGASPSTAMHATGEWTGASRSLARAETHGSGRASGLR